MENTEKKTTGKGITVVRVIEPVIIHDNTPDVPKGHVLMAQVDAEGREKPNTDTVIGILTYEKHFANNPKWKLKKKSKSD
jgi:hypothetical protein